MIVQGDNWGDPALTKRFYGLDSLLVLGPSLTIDFKNGGCSCLHGPQDEVGTAKHKWSAWSQYDVTRWEAAL